MHVRHREVPLWITFCWIFKNLDLTVIAYAYHYIDYISNQPLFVSTLTAYDNLYFLLSFYIFFITSFLQRPANILRFLYPNFQHFQTPRGVSHAICTSNRKSQEKKVSKILQEILHEHMWSLMFNWISLVQFWLDKFDIKSCSIRIYKICLPDGITLVMEIVNKSCDHLIILNLNQPWSRYLWQKYNLLLECLVYLMWIKTIRTGFPL